MEKSVVYKYLQFSYKNNKILTIKTTNEKEIDVFIVGFQNKLIKYKFKNSNKISCINSDNIVSTDFKNKEDKKEFLYQILGEFYGKNRLKETIENFEKYYLSIIEILLAKENRNSKGYINLSNKRQTYPKIFNTLLEDSHNLLFYYFTKKQPKNVENNINQKEILLVEQANLSQKRALKNALNERISIIEGPPGTGKTTTILNILANLIYRNKKVLVVSKNNSAIENVADELSQMNIPKCFIRMRKFRRHERRT